jgi:hypothetical protein
MKIGTDELMLNAAALAISQTHMKLLPSIVTVLLVKRSDYSKLLKKYSACFQKLPNI